MYIINAFYVFGGRLMFVFKLKICDKKFGFEFCFSYLVVGGDGGFLRSSWRDYEGGGR